jgi:clan AA aspartic protease (TIGR02281 family)
MVAVVAILFSFAMAARGDELSEARAALDKAGIRASSAAFVLAKEAELTKELGKSLLLRRNVLQAQKDLLAAEQKKETLQRGLTQLKQQHTQLSAQLASINPNDVSLNNRLVGALNAIAGQHDLARDQLEGFDNQVKAARSKANEVREAYLQFVLDARKLADEIEAGYSRQATPETKAAIDRYNAAAGKQLALAPTSGFAANLRRLKQLEDTVLSETIELHDDGSRTLSVSVVVNGKHQQEMMLDSGASLISLPAAVAAKFGLKPSDKDPRIILELADGRQIEGRLMKLASVRVGKFIVEDVECAVLGDAATSAEPLLGMSFLEHFKFEIDSAARKLTMVKIAAGESTTSAKTAK